MAETNILRSINEKMKGTWFDQTNSVWHFTPNLDNTGTVTFKDETKKYRFIDERAPKLEIEFYNTYNYTNHFLSSEIHLERNKTDFVYLSRKKLDMGMSF